MGSSLGAYITVSSKVSRELKEEAERLGIRISEVLRRALEEEVRRRRLEALRGRVEELAPALEKIDVAEIVGLIRADRDQR